MYCRFAVASYLGLVQLLHLTSGITQSSPELIAYVAVQAQFALSSHSSWTRSDSKFKFARFYLNIFFAHASDRWKESLFKFWNRECFHDIPNTAEAPANDLEPASLFTESFTPEDNDSEDGDNQQGATNRGVNEGGGNNDNGGNGNGGDSEDDGGQVNGGDGYIDEVIYSDGSSAIADDSASAFEPSFLRGLQSYNGSDHITIWIGDGSLVTGALKLKSSSALWHLGVGADIHELQITSNDTISKIGNV
ncbi:hypothetical protein DFJ43DRAFT_1044468 [Lentinula guzmanii]|uniref:Uncharacterized protein n=1 Tax=Lentinula guzmanii TaxID=2804957 RepID=A0AA38MU74_9AGAR|nr:hypothetical protein DFJ43DRAFT_1044468 [Lentinula guzmanii]